MLSDVLFALFIISLMLISELCTYFLTKQEIKKVRDELEEVKRKLDALVPIKVNAFDDDFKIPEVKKPSKAVVYNPTTDPMSEFSGQRDDFYGDRNE